MLNGLAYLYQHGRIHGSEEAGTQALPLYMPGIIFGMIYRQKVSAMDFWLLTQEKMSEYASLTVMLKNG